MKIVAFAASSSKHSINKQLVTHATNVMHTEINTDAQIEILDLNDFDMPIYSIDRENDNGIPPQAHSFYKKIESADALVISYAEHNYNYTSAYKNIFDWASRIQMKVFQDKPVLAMSASIGPNGGAGVLKTVNDSAPFFGADIQASFSVGPFAEKFDSEAGVLTDPELAKALRLGLKQLHASVKS